MKKLLTHHPWVLALVLILVVNLPAAVMFTHAVNCINVWADRTSTRSSVLSEKADKRTIALDDMIRSVGTQDPATFKKKYDLYISASDDFNQAQKENPVPESPRLVC